MRRANSGMKRTSLRHVLYITKAAIDHFQGIGVIPVKERLYQLSIMLKNIEPSIWRRIQVRDCPRQAPRADTDRDGLDQLASIPIPDQ